MSNISVKFHQYLVTFASDITAKFKLPVSFSPEDQLKGPVMSTLKEAGSLYELDVSAVTEVHLEEMTRQPDIGILVKSLITGHIELKAPGKGADANKLKGADKQQWEKFKDLPNLMYTDGNEWALYRNGERVGKLLKLSGDVTTDGKKAIGEADLDSPSKGPKRPLWS
jgi:hypothetical protein